MHNVGVPEGEDTEKGRQNLCEKIMAENFPKMEKRRDIEAQDIEETPKQNESPRKKHYK